MKYILAIFFSFFLFLGFGLCEQVSFSDFSGGLRTDVNSDLLQANESPDCENVIVSEIGTSLLKRRGFAIFSSLVSSFTVNSSNKYIDMSIGAVFPEERTAIVAEGIYENITDLLAAVTTALVAVGVGDEFKAELSGGKVKIYRDIPIGNIPLNLYFATGTHADKSMAYMLGFAASDYTGVWEGTGYTAPNVYVENTATTDSSGCQGFSLFQEESTGYDYFITPHGQYVSKLYIDNGDRTDFITDRTTTTTTYDQYTLDEEYIYGCNGYDYNWRYDGTTLTRFSTYTVTTGSIYFDFLIDSTTTNVIAGTNNSQLALIDTTNDDIDSLLDLDNNVGAITYDGTSHWVTIPTLNKVNKVDLANSTIDDTVTVGNNPTSIEAYVDNIFIVNEDDDTVTIYEDGVGTVETVTVGDKPSAIISEDYYIGDEAVTLTQTASYPNILDGVIDSSYLYFTNGTSLYRLYNTSTTAESIGTIANHYQITIDSNNYTWAASTTTSNIYKVYKTSDVVISTYNFISELNVISVGDYPSALEYDGSYLYCSNYNDDTISKINPSNNVIISSLTVGTNPNALHFFSGDLYCANYSDNTVSKISTNTFTIISSMTVGDFPQALEDDGEFLYCTGGDGVSFVSKIDIDNMVIISSIPFSNTANPYDLHFFNGDLYAANEGDDTVVRVSTTTQVIVSTITVGTTPRILSDDDTYIYCSNGGDNTISKISTSDVIISSLTVGSVPWGLHFFNGDLYCANAGDDNVSKISTNTFTIISSVTVQNYPTILYDDTEFVYCINRESDTVSRINMNDRTIADSLFANNYLWLAFEEDRIWQVDVGSAFDINNVVTTNIDNPKKLGYYDSSIWAANYDGASVTRIAKDSATVIAEISVSSSALDMAYDTSQYVYVVTEDSATIDKIDVNTNSLGTGFTTSVQYPDYVEYGKNYLAFSSIASDEFWIINLQDNSALSNETANFSASYSDIFFNSSVENNFYFANTENTFTKANFDDYHLYVANENDDTVIKFRHNDFTNSSTTISVGTTPIDLDRDTNNIYCLNYGDETISKISKTTDLVVSSITTGSTPQDIFVDNDTYLYVTNLGNDNIYRIELAGFTLNATIPVGDPVYVTRVGDYLYCVQSDNNIVKIDTTTFSLTYIDNTKYTVYDFPKTFTHAFFKERYWIANTTTTPNKIWHSVEEDPLNFDTLYSLDELNLNADNFTIGATGKGINKLFNYSGTLMVFKDDSIYRIVGEETPFSIIPVSKFLGCPYANSICEDSGYLYFFGNDKYFYTFDGANLTRISQNIRESITKNISYVSSKWYRAKMYSYIQYTDDTDDIFVFDILTNSWWRYDGFYPYQLESYKDDLYLADERFPYILRQEYSSPVYYDYYSSTSTAQAINSYYYTRLDYLDNPVMKKSLNYFSILMKAQSTGSFYLDYLINDVTSQQLTYSMVDSNSKPSIIRNNRYPRGEKGDYFQWKFYNAQASQTFDLYNFLTDYEVLEFLEISE